ncbi:integrase catalytic domain-containing protein [Trichonephila clavata]|uniref:Integrase catalytic domain-containing protein n=1 Tax=Trichonephila clavata TaxID=2740835 RepID=A0A8X6I0D9_TRICU|nr:integrase catalytic domain-containing protein [Trichonephila clavata]
MMKFLSDEVQGALTALKTKGDTVMASLPPTTAFYVNTKRGYGPKKNNYIPFCAFYESAGHWAQKYETITEYIVIDCDKYNNRIQKLKSYNRFLCPNCGHKVTNCPHKDFSHCTKCKIKHHVSICPPNPSPSIPNREVNHISTPKTNFTHLQTALLYITGLKGTTQLTRCIFDGGSQTSFVDVSLIDKLKLSVVSSEKLNIHTFESATSSQTIKFSLSSVWNKNSALITAFESSNKYYSHPAVPTDIVRFAESQKLKLADPQEDSKIPTELLIGGDFHWHVVTTKSPIKVKDSSFMIPSILDGY